MATFPTTPAVLGTKTAPVDADTVLISDSADSNRGKIITLGNLAPLGWRDIEGPVQVRTTGAGRPTWSQIGTTSFYAYDFAVNDSCWFTYHIPHDIADTTVHFHTHFLLDDTNTTNFVWEYTWAYAKGYDQAAFDLAITPIAGASGVITATLAGAGTAFTHQIAETIGVDITGLTEPDGMIMMSIKRITNGGSDKANGVFMITSDVHYLSDSGSTLNRNYPY